MHPQACSVVVHFFLLILSLLVCSLEALNHGKAWIYAIISDLFILGSFLMVSVLYRESKPNTFMMFLGGNIFFVVLIILVWHLIEILRQKFTVNAVLVVSDIHGLLVSAALGILGIVMINYLESPFNNLKMDSENIGYFVMGIFAAIIFAMGLRCTSYIDSDIISPFKKILFIHSTGSLIFSIIFIIAEIFYIDGSPDYWKQAFQQQSWDSIFTWREVSVVLIFVIYRIAFIYTSRYSDMYTFAIPVQIGISLGLSFAYTDVYTAFSSLQQIGENQKLLIFIILHLLLFVYWILRVIFYNNIIKRKIHNFIILTENRYRPGSLEEKLFIIGDSTNYT